MRPEPLPTTVLYLTLAVRNKVITESKEPWRLTHLTNKDL